MSSQELLSRLSEYDFIIAIDASGSMAEPDMPNKRTRWQYAQETITAFARELEAIDSDGIDVLFFSGSKVNSFIGVTTEKVKDIFSTRSPMGTTPLAEALLEAFKLAGKSDKKDFILVLTDGVPDNQAFAADVIVKHSNTLTADDDCTVLFVQVGHDAGASEYLRNLDDNLKGAKFDIVDAKTIAEVESFDSLAELIVAAIND